MVNLQTAPFSSVLSALLALPFILSIAAMPSRNAFASDDAVAPEFAAPEIFHIRRAARFAVPAAEVFDRTRAVINHYGVTPEPDFQVALDPLADRQTWKELVDFAKILNPGGDWREFLMTSEGAPIYEAAQDRGSRKLLDYSLRVADKNEVIPASALTTRLTAAHIALAGGATLSLGGLKIAIDPGHMGGDDWDRRTGKYVQDAQGRKISEGVLALQTSLLLEKELQALGATVKLTRRSLGPVSPNTRDNYDLAYWARRTLSETTPNTWFLDMSSSRPSLEAPALGVIKAFDSAPEIRSIFSDTRRDEFFILGEDLQARVDSVDAFAPDLTLVLHYDAVPPAGDPNGVGKKNYNATKAYVPGALSRTEMSSRTDRADFAQQAFDPEAWNGSVQLSRAVVGEVKAQLGIPFDPQSPGGVVPIEPGIYSRALFLNRKIAHTALSYVEILFYNDPTEFAKHLVRANPLSIDGVNVPYSDRTLQVAQVLRDGIVRFLRDYQPSRQLP